jgi:hypothetical protein
MRSAQETFRRFAQKDSAVAFATIKTTSCSIFFPTHPIPTTSYRSPSIQFPRLVDLLSARQQWPQCFYLDRNRASGLEPGWVKIDHYLSPSDISISATGSVTARNSIRSRLRDQPCQAFRLTRPAGANLRAQETHTFSPSMIGVFRFSFLRNKFLLVSTPVTPLPLSSASDTLPALTWR